MVRHYGYIAEKFHKHEMILVGKESIECEGKQSCNRIKKPRRNDDIRGFLIQIILFDSVSESLNLHCYFTITLTRFDSTPDAT